MSTDGSVQFFSTIDEDLNVTVETLTRMMQRNLSSEKVELAHQNLLTIARHNPQTDANEINQDKPSESDSSTPTIEVQRTSPTQGIDTMSPQFTTPEKGIRITRKMASQGYNPDLHYHDQTAHAFLGHAESIPTPTIDPTIPRPTPTDPSNMSSYQREHHISILKETLNIVNLVLECFAAKKKIRGDHNPTLTQAHKQEDWLKYKAALEIELQDLVSFGTGIRVLRSDLPPGTEITPSKVEFLKKVDAEGNYDKHKARLVVMSNLAKSLIYDQVFAPCAHPCTLKMLLAIFVRDSLFMSEFDVKAAFLNADLDQSKPVFISFPARTF